MENGTPLLRAANNGISAVVDARGRVVDAFGIDARGNLDVHLPIAKEGLISAGQRRVNGFLILWLFGALAVAWAARQRLQLN